MFRLADSAGRSQDGVAGASHPAFDEQLQIGRAAFVSIEAMLERVVEPVQAEMVGTTGVGSVQKRAMMGALICSCW
jgi:hypothetical protein